MDNITRFFNIIKVVQIIISLLFVLNFGETAPEVKTDYGTYIGHLTKSRSGREVSTYEGIPYAKSPIGSLRFKEPEPLDKNDKVYNATKPGNSCYQKSFGEFLSEDFDFTSERYVGNEDCLYLNVYVPKVEKDAGKLPVMFFIHGGGYIMGSGSADWNGPDYFLDKDIIVVSFNHRLSILGFLHVDGMFENLGMKDQALALKWVNENIKAFGGDPDSVTISGISAGSSAVFLHLHSPMSKGLFIRAIGQSGTLDCDWAVRSRKEARKVVSKVVHYLGCSNETNLLMRCLQKMPVLELFKAISSFKEDKTGFPLPLGPIVESESPNAFVTETSIKQGSEIPLLTGVTSEEGLSMYNMLLKESPGYADDLVPLKKSYKVLLPIIANYAENPAADEITVKLVQYYFGDKGFTNETIANFIQLLSDTMFNHGLHTSARKHKGKLYQYMMNYTSNITMFSQIRPPTLKNVMGHGEDMLFFYNAEALPQVPLNDQNLEFSHFVIDLFTNFIIFGDPTPESKLWKESKDGSEYLELSNEGRHTMKTDMFKERMEFLDGVFPMNLENKIKLL